MNLLYKAIPVVKENKNWLVIAVMFFLFGFITTFSAFRFNPEAILEIGSEQLEMLEELGQQVFGGHPLRGILVLFYNNLLATIIIMVLSFLLGIPPLLSLIVNGGLIGLVAAMLQNEGSSILVFMVFGIIPHGILELPAFLFVAALGLKMGYHIIFPMSDKKRGESIKYVWNEFMQVFPLVLVFLILAAVIEVLITPSLLGLVTL